MTTDNTTVTKQPRVKKPISLRWTAARMPAQGPLIVFLVALLILFSVQSPFFLTMGNFRNILVSVAVLGLIAVPVSMLVIAAHLDLSVASIAALSGMIVAVLGAEHGLVVGVLAALAIGTVLGLFNGFMVAVVGINSIIATLGTLSIYRGAAKLTTQGQTARIPGFEWLGSGQTLGIPNAAALLVIVAVILHVVLKYTVFGRSVYAIGSNVNAARLTGINVRRHILILFLVVGFCSALAGLVLTSQLRAASPVTASGLELSVVAAILLGGASLNGGRGSVGGTLLGVLVLGTLNNGLTILSVSSFWQEVARGAVLILAVGLDQVRQRMQTT